MTQHKPSHRMTWPSHDLTPQQTSRHQNTSLQSTKHHHHGTAEGSFTAKKWFGHRAGRSPCTHSIGKFCLCYIVLFLLETSAPGLSGHYWYYILCNAIATTITNAIATSVTSSSSSSCCSYYRLILILILILLLLLLPLLMPMRMLLLLLLLLLLRLPLPLRHYHYHYR